MRTFKKLFGKDKRVLAALAKKGHTGKQQQQAAANESGEEVGGVAGMTNTFEPTRVTAILKDNRDLILKLKQAEEENIQKQLNFRFNKKQNTKQ